MLQNENLQEEEQEIDTGIESQDENQEEENLEIEQEEEEEEEKPKKKSLVQTLREEIKELKKAQKSKSLDQDLETRLFFIEHPELKEDREMILSVMSEHPSLSYEQAHVLGKSQKPKESTSKKEAFKGGQYKSPPKTIQTMSDTEAEWLDHIDWLKRIGYQ